MRENTTPWIHTLALDAPSLKDNTADADRLLRALNRRLNTDAVQIDLELARRLPELLRQHRYRIRCILWKNRQRWQLLEVTGAEDTRIAAGVAVDLGTTRVELRLVDLVTARTLAETSFANPQEALGPDILTRIHFAEKKDGLAELNRLIVGSLNRAIAGLCDRRQIQPEQIYALAVAGNTTMTHFFMGLESRWIIREPYIPAINQPGIERAAALGLEVHPQARVLIFPNIGSYFGGDLIAGILYSGIHQKAQTGILVDVGTNAEVVLGNENWLIACAGAAGPALEGGVTRMGMTAGPGVIDRISVQPHTLEFNIHTIDDLPPTGICGSGIIDLAAQLFLSGMIDIRGKLVPAVCGPRIKKIDSQLHLVVVPAEKSAAGTDLTISQVDLDSLIRSKAAMYTILETLTAAVGLTPRELESFFVAGTFGAFINPQSAIAIGMLPDLPLERYKPLGNSSLGGAALALQSDKYHDEIDRIRNRVTYLELNVNQDFMNRFNAAKFLPHTNTKLFPSVKIIQKNRMIS
jgi:uncharacterized 2Fe-2S/4Fe-4S cluster protein (DUF4445 family)